MGSAPAYQNRHISTSISTPAYQHQHHHKHHLHHHQHHQHSKAYEVYLDIFQGAVLAGRAQKFKRKVNSDHLYEKITILSIGIIITIIAFMIIESGEWTESRMIIIIIIIIMTIIMILIMEGGVGSGRRVVFRAELSSGDGSKVPR